MNANSLKLDPATERIANNLLRHLEWQAQGFSLAFLFADIGPGLSLASWLEQRLLEIGTGLESHEVGDDFVAQPQKLVDEIVDQRIGKKGSSEPLWLWLHRHPADEQWNSARRLLLARLNERRFLLERDLRRPLILVLPFAFKSEARAIAPDLWTIRALSEELRAPQTSGVEAIGTSVLPLPNASGAGSVGLPASLDAPARLPAYEDWCRSYAAAPGHAFLATAHDAVNELLQAGRPEDAKVVAEQALRIAEKRAAAYPDNLAPLYDLAWSLDTAAEVASLQGNWSEAESFYQTRLAISRQLLERLGGSREALRHLSIALANVAGLARARGDWSEAENLYRESLSINRQLLEHFGANRESLRELSISLAHVAGLASAQGNWTEAETLFRESLAINRQLVKRFGGTALRELSISLARVAFVASAQGNWSEAETLFRESLAISYQLLERRGSTPEALRDLSMSLDNVAGVASAQGNWTEAERLYRKSLAIRRQLLERFGDAPEALDDVGSSLFQLGTLGEKRDEALLKEALQIYEGLVSRCPSIVRYQSRLRSVREALER